MTGIAILGIEILGKCLQILNLLPHLVNFVHVFIDLLVVLPDNSVLDFQSAEQVFLDHTEFEIGLALQDLKDQEWTQDLILLVLGLLRLLLETDGGQSPL